MANSKSSDTRPCRKRYTSEQRWIKNKLRKVKKFYKKHFNYSKNRKEKDLKLPEKERPHRKYFCDKYPSEDIFLATVKIKKTNIVRKEIPHTFKIPENLKMYGRRT